MENSFHNLKLSFIYLSAFSTQGGIEKFNRAMMHALNQLSSDASFFSLYDQEADIDEKYLAKGKIMGIKRSSKVLRLLFLLFYYLFAKKQQVIWGHINFAPIANCIQFFRPQHHFILIAHGIDVWENLNSSKRKFLRQADEIWAVSTYTKSRLLELDARWEKKIKIFPNALDPFFPALSAVSKPAFLKERYQLEEAEKVLLTLCRISSSEGYKGYDRLIEALPLLHEKKLRYLIAGKYDEEEQQRLIELAKRHKVEEQLLFTGFLKEEEIQAHYQLADLFVMPSTNEGFGIVFIEALACGTPVVAGNRDGSVDALQNGQLGSLVDPRSPAAIAAAIDSLLADAQLKDFDRQNERIQKVQATFGFPLFQERLKEFLKR